MRASTTLTLHLKLHFLMEISYRAEDFYFGCKKHKGWRVVPLTIFSKCCFIKRSEKITYIRIKNYILRQGR